MRCSLLGLSFEFPELEGGEEGCIGEEEGEEGKNGAGYVHMRLLRFMRSSHTESLRLRQIKERTLPPAKIPSSAIKYKPM